MENNKCNEEERYEGKGRRDRRINGQTKVLETHCILF
jgi:hypothetical protein